MIKEFVAAMMLIVASTAAFACGQERWPVKTGTDRDAAQVTPQATASTVSALAQLPSPPDPNVRRDIRFAPAETSVVAVSAILTVIKREKDQDYHLVIEDPETGESMIIESPDPQCALGSRFAAEIADARATIDRFFRRPIVRRRQVQIPVSVVGIPFFDPLHGQEGVAPNGIELHPILHIQFN